MFWKLRKAVELARCALTFRAERSDPSRKYVGFDLREAPADACADVLITYNTGWPSVAPAAVAARTIVDLMMGNGNCDASDASS